MYGIGIRIPFSRYVINHWHLYVTNYYTFVCTITFLLLTVCLTSVKANISPNITFTTIKKFDNLMLEDPQWQGATACDPITEVKQL